MIDGLTWAVRAKGYRSTTPVSPATRASMEGFRALGVSATFGDLAREARRQAADEPAGLARLLGWKLLRPLWGTDSGRQERPVAVVNLSLLGLYLVAMRAVAREDAGSRAALGAAGALLALFWGMAAVSLPIARYLAPPLALVAGLLPLALPRRGSREGGPVPGPRPLTRTSR
jgi:hypothetical protein